jgi:hypothetical protein
MPLGHVLSIEIIEWKPLFMLQHTCNPPKTALSRPVFHPALYYAGHHCRCFGGIKMTLANQMETDRPVTVRQIIMFP